MSDHARPVPASLLDAGIYILTTTDAYEKAYGTMAYAALWKAGDLPISAAPAIPEPPARAHRPGDILIVAPSATSAKGFKGTVHALAHAESHAIDLSWDMLVRFAQETGQPGQLRPRAFFDDWCQVALDEAHHFLCWAAELDRIGHPYGTIPAHDGLADDGERTSHDILARCAVIHCVHEARGLDVAQGLEQKLARSSRDAAGRLAVNAEQEISHVAAGVRWFLYEAAQRGIEDTVATYQSLVSELFHGRLKPPFNMEARDAAGMPRSWYMPEAAAAPAPASS